MPSEKPRYTPLYAQIKHHLTRRIATGEWKTDEALPSEWELAEELDVSQGTVRKALGELTLDGWLYRQQGKGTFVAAGASEWGDGKLVGPGGFFESPEPVSAELLSVGRVVAGEEVAGALGLRRGAALHHVRQLWRQRGVVVALDNVLLSADRFEEIDARRLRMYGGSVYALLERQFSVRIRIGRSQFRAVRAARDEAQLLGVDMDEPLLAMARLGVTVGGEVVEWRQRLVRSQRWAWQPD